MLLPIWLKFMTKSSGMKYFLKISSTHPRNVGWIFLKPSGSCFVVLISWRFVSFIILRCRPRFINIDTLTIFSQNRPVFSTYKFFGSSYYNAAVSIDSIYSKLSYIALYNLFYALHLPKSVLDVLLALVFPFLMASLAILNLISGKFSPYLPGFYLTPLSASA